MTSRRTLVRFSCAILPVALGIAILSGCDDAYDIQIMYTGRTDWIVEKLPTLQPTRYDPPGILPLMSLDGDKNSFGPDQGLLKKEREEKKSIYSPLDLKQTVRDEITRALRDLAGRPRKPKIDLNDLRFEDTNRDLTKVLKLDRKTLEQGSKLYRNHCLHCHGLNGDGKGPTGNWVNPHPRDYRQGVFKFTSSGQDLGVRKPRREDLKRVLLNGIDGTSMPSFHLLPDEELEALISYVIHLSIRGEAEFSVMIDLLKEAEERAGSTGPKDDDQGEPIISRVRSAAATAGQRWLAAQAPEAKIKPTEEYAKNFEKMTKEERLASAARGYKIFNTKELGGCVQCHVNAGRDSPYYYDAWGTIVRPRNLLSNNLRGGRRPIDLYWRIHSGINGSGMPALISTEADLKMTAPKELNLPASFGNKEQWIWDLVNYIQMVPYPEIRKDLREKFKIEIE